MVLIKIQKWSYYQRLVVINMKIHVCPKCGAPTVKRTNKKLNVVFFGCSKFPVCKGNINTEGKQTEVSAKLFHRELTDREEDWQDLLVLYGHDYYGGKLDSDD